MRTLWIMVAIGLASGALGFWLANTFVVPTQKRFAPRVLFIGNSLTASNDLPEVVHAMVRSTGGDLRVETCARGGVSLEDHWNDGHCRKLLEENRYHYVVLQQGPSSRDDSRANLKEWSVRWADAIRARHAQPALYMVWPQQGQPSGFARVSDSYRMAAEQSRARLLPAGDAWRAAADGEHKVILYGSDGLHPTREGTYLAALVIAHHLAGVRPEDVPERLVLDSGDVVEVASDDAATLRRAASSVLPVKTKTP
jgi:hypothetical protein